MRQLSLFDPIVIEEIEHLNKNSPAKILPFKSGLDLFDTATEKQDQEVISYEQSIQEIIVEDIQSFYQGTIKYNGNTNQRKVLNQKVIELLKKEQLNQSELQEIFSSYSGIGQLTEAENSEELNHWQKHDIEKESEFQQFFTSPELAKFMVQLLDIEPNSSVIDITCGHGVFFNYLTQAQLYGIELQTEAYQVGKALYPKANLLNSSMAIYNEEWQSKLDYSIGNPPFNLTLDGTSDFELLSQSGNILSQDMFLENCIYYLKKGGIACFVVPYTWLHNELRDSKVNRYIDSNYHRIAQFTLPANIFKEVGVKNYKTQIVLLQKRYDDNVDFRLYQYDVKDLHQSLIDWKKSFSYSQYIKSKKIAQANEIKRKHYQYFENKRAEYYKTALEKKIASICTTQELRTYYDELLSKMKNQKYELEKEIAEVFTNIKSPERRSQLVKELQANYEESRLTLTAILGKVKSRKKRLNKKENWTVKLVKNKYEVYFKCDNRRLHAYLTSKLGEHFFKKYSFNDLVFSYIETENKNHFYDELYKWKNKLEELEALDQEDINSEQEELLRDYRSLCNYFEQQIYIADRIDPYYSIIKQYLNEFQKIKFYQTQKETLPIAFKQDFNLDKLIKRKVKEYLKNSIPIRCYKYIEPTKWEAKANEIKELVFPDPLITETKPLEHQYLDLASAQAKDYVFYNHETGLGKSMIGVLDSLLYNKSKYPTLIVSTSNIIYNTWKKELVDRGFTGEFIIIEKPSDLYNAHKYSFVLCSNEKLTYSRNNNDHFRDCPQCQTMHAFEASNTCEYCGYSIRNPVNYPLYKRLSKLKYGQIIIDESQNLKNTQAVRTKAISWLAKRAKRKTILTADMTLNNANELYSQLNLLLNHSINFICLNKTVKEYDIEKKEYIEKPNSMFLKPFAFKKGASYFSKFHSPKKKTVFGEDKDEQTLHHSDYLFFNLDKVQLRRADVTSSDQQTIFKKKSETQTIMLDMTEAERKVYAVLLKEFQRVMEEVLHMEARGKKADMLAIAQQIRLLFQATSSAFAFPYWDEREPKVTAKMLKIKELCLEAQKEGKKIMVGSPWQPTIQRYNEWFRELNIPFTYLSSSKTPSQRFPLIENFRTNKDTVLLSTFGVLREGISLPEVSRVICDSYQWNYVRYAQYVARAVRINSPETVKIYNLAYNGSIDMNILNLMLLKQILSLAIKDRKFIDKKDLLTQFGFQDGDDIMNFALKLVKDKDKHTIEITTHEDWRRNELSNVHFKDIEESITIEATIEPEEEKLTPDEILAQLDQCYCSDQIYKHSIDNNYCYTDGVKTLVELCKSYWLMDLIVSWQLEDKVKDEPFQAWTISVYDDKTAMIKCDDGDGNILAQQDILSTDFPLNKYKIYLENNIIMLPQER